ncbi:2-hydroxy-3-keto-5-methylthiopentenyl-1-phosphate phosphatase [Rossellomorea aquimaris]|uniref:2-hydroxy-3-keto-5-methylthiopentenyl-1- phosphate phosphatase n=1 Tax=Rossellomorea aquimaris TaxID=189382 RepID=UPI001CD54C43|nr:2-hydroxy-3-keto-5-methylthiopentenyl-1-phosphate phosphatase [Rossellomorea aquimaris]MCA1059397.1 2-hydroxy-3-keto-5-methylthiopentenyl-1-phosphate phosphatase [Rossellomorea aquimaris]
MTRPIILCDFDGTITETDNIISLMKHFAPPEWEPIKDAVLERSLSIKEGVTQLFSLIPSSMKDEMIQYLRNTAVIRKGFKEFVEYTIENRISLYIVSGGIDFFIHPILEAYGPFQEVFCNEASFSETTISIRWPYPCDEQCGSKGCGCCKPSILRTLSKPEGASVIVIGDSVTDLELAKQGDMVIARDYLAQKCKEDGIPFISFETFHDCIEALEKEGVIT